MKALNVLKIRIENQMFAITFTLSQVWESNKVHTTPY